MIENYDDFELENQIVESIQVPCSKLKVNDSVMVEGNPIKVI